ncbi:SDR family NAD(P)-dependent oxidoreductase [Pseudonocardia benzenivorans]
MIPKGWGRIINVGSESALTAMPGQVMYGALKGGLATFTAQLGAEVERHGVKVLGVYGGCMWGPGRDLLPDSVLGQYALGRTAIQRFELPEEVANMIGFLATDAASAMTGVMIPMGGGWRCRAGGLVARCRTRPEDRKTTWTFSKRWRPAAPSAGSKAIQSLRRISNGSSTTPPGRPARATRSSGGS